MKDVKDVKDVKDIVPEGREIKLKVNGVGQLEMLVRGVMRTMRCPFNSGFCGDTCPLFSVSGPNRGEGGSGHSTMVIELCHSKRIVVNEKNFQRG